MMRSRWMLGFLTAATLLVSTGSMADNKQGHKGGGPPGGGGSDPVCTAVTYERVGEFNDPSSPGFTGELGGGLQVWGPLSSGEYLVVTTSAFFSQLELFTLDVSGGTPMVSTADPILLPGNLTAGSISVGDIDGDSDPDIAVGDGFAAGGAGVAILYLNQGNLSFQDPPTQLDPKESTVRFGTALTIDALNGGIFVSASEGSVGRVFQFEIDFREDGTVAEIDVVSFTGPNEGETGDAFGRHLGMLSSSGEPIVGAPWKDNGRKNRNAGITYLYPVPPVELIGKKNEGLSFRVTADVDGDGQEDIVTGTAIDATSQRSVVFLGPFAGVRHSNENTIVLPVDSDLSGGYGPTSAGDLNGDGDAEVLVGAPNAGNGVAYLYLSDPMDGPRQCTIIEPPDTSGGLFGWSVAVVPNTSFFLVSERKRDYGGDGSFDGQIYIYDALGQL